MQRIFSVNGSQTLTVSLNSFMHCSLIFPIKACTLAKGDILGYNHTTITHLGRYSGQRGPITFLLTVKCPIPSDIVIFFNNRQFNQLSCTNNISRAGIPLINEYLYQGRSRSLIIHPSSLTDSSVLTKCGGVILDAIYFFSSASFS